MKRYIIYFFYLLSILHVLFGTKENLIFLRLAQFSGLTGFIISWNYFGMKLYQSKSLIRLKGYIVSLLTVIGIIFIGIINLRLNLFSTIYPISFLGISLLIIVTRPKTNFFVYISIIVYILLSYYFMSGLSPSDWTKGSRNHVSVLVLYISITPFLIHLLHEKNTNFLIQILFPFLAVLFSILSIGRSGIITTTVYFIINLFLYLNAQKHRYKNYAILLVTIIIFFPKIQVFIEFILNDYLYKFIRKGVKLEARNEIIQYYLNSLNFKTFLLSSKNLSVTENMNNSLHNSYLNWHYQLGFLSFFILSVVMNSLYITIKRNKYIALILLVILIRSFTDQVLLTDGILLGLPFILSLFLVNKKYKIIYKYKL